MLPAVKVIADELERGGLRGPPGTQSQVPPAHAQNAPRRGVVHAHPGCGGRAVVRPLYQHTSLKTRGWKGGLQGCFKRGSGRVASHLAPARTPSPAAGRPASAAAERPWGSAGNLCQRGISVREESLSERNLCQAAQVFTSHFQRGISVSQPRSLLLLESSGPNQTDTRRAHTPVRHICD